MKIVRGILLGIGFFVIAQAAVFATSAAVETESAPAAVEDSLLPNVSEVIDESLSKVIWEGEGFRLQLRTLLWVIFILVAGYLGSAFIAAMVQRKVYSKIGQSVNGSHIARRSTFTVLMLFVVLLALNVSGIPLTAFAFFGGALALGFGFGAQNICNNLISGIILIFEHPFKVNDVIEVNGQAGVVHLIGLRATRIRTHDGIILLVPNSYFLSNPITNRSNASKRLRGCITIGVDYSTDSRAFSETLCALAASHPAVVEKPYPMVLFKDFGSVALVFDLLFWVDTTKQGVAAVSSDLRHQILAETTRQNIKIPLPQLDVFIKNNEVAAATTTPHTGG